MAQFDGKKFGEEIVATVKAYVGNVVNPIIDRIKTLEELFQAMPTKADLQAMIDKAVDAFRPEIDEAKIQAIVDAAVDKAVAGIERVKGDPGKDADPAFVRATVAEEVKAAVAGLPKPKDGKDAAPIDMNAVGALIKEAVGEAVDAWPRPVDGKSVTLADVQPMIMEAIDKAVSAIDPIGLAAALIDRDGNLVVTLSNGEAKELGPVVGKSVDEASLKAEIKATIEEKFAALPKPKDGIDGLGFDDLRCEFDGERGFKIRFSNADKTKEFDFTVPVPIYRGVWKQGAFKQGDVVTWDGCMWHAMTDTDGFPGKSSDWRMCVKKGDRGTSASTPVSIKPGPVALPGRSNGTGDKA